MKQKLISSIGHSTHTIEESIAMLKSFSIELLADIRSYPSSRKFPLLLAIPANNPVCKK